MRFSTDFRFGSLSDARDAEVQESSWGLEEVGGAGFFFTGFALDARASKGEMNSNMDLRGDGGAGWETGSGWGGGGSSLGGSWGT